MSTTIESAKLKSEIVPIWHSMNETAYCSTNDSIYSHFIALVLNVDYVVSSINEYIQEKIYYCRTPKADGEKQTAFLKLVTKISLNQLSKLMQEKSCFPVIINVGQAFIIRELPLCTYRVLTNAANNLPNSYYNNVLIKLWFPI